MNKTRIEKLKEYVICVTYIKNYLWVQVFLLFTLFLLFIFLIPYIWLQNEVVASSPSFPIQQVQDERGDLNIDVVNNTIRAIYPNIAFDPLVCTVSNIYGSNYPVDIISVSYYSDGSYLNATIWLDTFTEGFDYDIISIISRDYSIQIDVKSVYDAYSAYFASVMYWNNKSQFWTKELIEFSGPIYSQDYRYIEIIPISLI